MEALLSLTSLSMIAIISRADSISVASVLILDSCSAMRCSHSLSWRLRFSRIYLERRSKRIMLGGVSPPNSPVDQLVDTVQFVDTHVQLLRHALGFGNLPGQFRVCLLVLLV